MVAGDNCIGGCIEGRENVHKDINEKSSGSHKLEIENMFNKRENKGTSGEGREETLGRGT